MSGPLLDGTGPPKHHLLDLRWNETTVFGAVRAKSWQGTNLGWSNIVKPDKRRAPLISSGHHDRSPAKYPDRSAESGRSRQHFLDPLSQKWDVWEGPAILPASTKQQPTQKAGPTKDLGPAYAANKNKTEQNTEEIWLKLSLWHY